MYIILHCVENQHTRAQTCFNELVLFSKGFLKNVLYLKVGYNKHTTEHRYIELFYRGNDKSRSGGGGKSLGRGGVGGRPHRPSMRDLPMLGMGGPARPMSRGRTGPMGSRKLRST